MANKKQWAETNASEEIAKEIAALVKKLQDLTHGNVGLSFDRDLLNRMPSELGKPKDRDAYWTNGLKSAAETILSLPSFNNRDNVLIVFGNEYENTGFESFYRALPTIDYGEGNPNNGNAMFNIELPDDATIILQASQFDFHDNGCKFDKEGLLKLAERYGKVWKADEISVDIETIDGVFGKGNGYKAVIRFWWD